MTEWLGLLGARISKAKEGLVAWKKEKNAAKTAIFQLATKLAANHDGKKPSTTLTSNVATRLSIPQEGKLRG